MKYIALTCILTISCGVGSPKPTPEASAELEMEKGRIQSLLPFCDGLYSRPDCDLGDSMTLVGVMARVQPEQAKEQLAASIDTDGRPFRSPSHLQRYRSGDQGDDVRDRSFSRDHVVSILFYTVFTKDPYPLIQVWNYAIKHDMKVCPGSTSQCSLTPAMLDQIGDAFAFCGKERPWQTRVPGAISAVTQMISVPSISSWQLTLAAEHILLKTITGNLNEAWQSLAEQIEKKSPQNLFYRFVKIASHGESASPLVSPLLEQMKQWEVPGKQWYWNDQNIQTATGYDLFLLADLIQRGI